MHSEANLLRLPNAEIVARWGNGATVAIEYSKYPSGEPLITWEQARSEKPPDVLLVRQRSMDAFMAAMFLVDAWVERGYTPPDLVLPQVPGARQDRLNDRGDFLFTAKSVARMINERGFPSVAVLDPHSDVVAALIDRCHVIRPAFNADYWKRKTYAGVIAPDSGAEKRAAVMAKANDLRIYHAWKTRDLRTGNITAFGVEALDVGHYLVVDDLCDGGGTFVGLARELQKQRCTADLYVTHGLFTKGLQPLLDCYERVITTDSVVRDHTNKLTIIPICNSYVRP